MAYSNNPNLPRARASALRMLLQDGVPLDVVAKRCGMHRTTIYRWKNKWRELNKHVEFTNPNRPTRSVSMSNKLSYCRWLIPTGSARPHRPNDNAHIERFNRTLRKECIGNYMSSHRTLDYVQNKLDKFLDYYNYNRIHLSLNCKTPANVKEEMLQRC